jgi:ubiquinone/menaquinone biosynthesis C-methylase UbiE
MSLVDNYERMHILDVGCGPDGRSFENYVDVSYKIIGIDILDENRVHCNHPNFTYIKKDAGDLKVFQDKQFDLTVSIGMMEHICNRQVLTKIAQQIQRVSRQFIIVVPWKWAWIEPHFKFPFFQLLPYNMQLLLTRILNLHNLRDAVTRDREYIKNHYQWLPSAEWNNIFWDSKTYVTPTLETIAIVKR